MEAAYKETFRQSSREGRNKGWLGMLGLVFGFLGVCLVVRIRLFAPNSIVKQSSVLLEKEAMNNQRIVPPANVVMILVDDLGFNDVGYNDKIGDVLTPEIDKLARDGIILDKYYSACTCTPARGALLTGMFPSKLGLQHGQIFPEEPWGLPLRFTILPQILKKEKNYHSVWIGKWHLGHYSPQSLPTARGFDSFFGGLDGAQYYSTHVDAMRCMLPMSLLSHGSQDYARDKKTILDHGCFFDLRENISPVQDHFGTYSTKLFANKAQEAIAQHFDSNKKKYEDHTNFPLFMVVSFNGVHAPVSVADETKLNTNVINGNRRKFLGALSEIDAAVGQIAQASRDVGDAHNTVFFFLSDNGANPEHGGSNQPLRGSKGFLFDGGVRVPAFIYAPGFFTTTNTHYAGLVHAVDIFSTIALGIAGCTSISAAPGVDSSLLLSSGKDLSTSINKTLYFDTTAEDYLKTIARTPGADIDGINLWPTFLSTTDKSFSSPAFEQNFHQRAEVLLGMDYLDASLSYTSEPLGYDTAGLIVMHWKILVNEGELGWYSVPNLADAVVRLEDHEHLPHTFLFNLDLDPNETTNLASDYPDIVNILLQRLVQHRKLMRPCEWRPLDPNASIAFRDLNQGFIGPWLFTTSSSDDTSTLPLSDNCANHMGNHDISRFRPPSSPGRSKEQHDAQCSDQQQKKHLADIAQHPAAIAHPNVVNHPNLAKAAHHQQQQLSTQMGKETEEGFNDTTAYIDLAAAALTYSPGRERNGYDW